jgi:hypothetical protein
MVKLTFKNLQVTLQSSEWVDRVLTIATGL